MFGTEGKAAQAAATKPTESTSPPKTDKNSSHRFLESTATTCTNKPDQEQSRFPSAISLMDVSKRTSADGEKLSATPCQPCVKLSGTFPQDSEPVVREKVYLKGVVPKPSVSPSLPRTSRATPQPGDVVDRTPPAGMSQQALRPGQPVGSPNTERLPSRCPMEVSKLRAALLERHLDMDFLRTTITLQQPVELNGEDELVFTVIEELPHDLVPDNGCPHKLLSSNRDCSLQTSSSGSQPVSIISSINDEYDAYTSQQGAVGPGADAGTDCQEMLFSQHSNERSAVGSWPSEVSAHPAESQDTHSTSNLYLRFKNMVTKNTSTPNTSSTFLKQPGIKSSLNYSSCFSELDSSHATPNKPLFSKCPPSPDSTKTSPKGTLKMRANTLNPSVSAQIPHPAAHSSLPRKTKRTSSGTMSCSRQGCRQNNFWLQESSDIDPREVDFLTASKPTRSGMSSVSSKRPGGNTNSVPWPVSSVAQRVVDGCERSSGQRRDTLIKLPRLTRGATTLGTVSIPQNSESKWGHEGTPVTGTSSLGKKSNVQKSILISKSGNISPPAPLITQSCQEQKTRTALSPSAFKTSNNTGKSSFPKTSNSEEEFNIRIQADSFSHRRSSLKTEHDSARTSSSLKARGTKAESFRCHGSLMSMERYYSQTLAGTKPELFRENSGANLGGKNKSVPRLGVPASTSSSASLSQDSPDVFATTIKALGQVRGNSSSRAAVSGGSKVRTLSTSSSKSLSSSSKPLDNVAGRNTSLPPTGKLPARSGSGAKMGRGTIMGTKQAINRVANSRVSELAAVSQRKQLSRGLRNEGTDSGTSSVSGSPINTPLPSPYSKITAPRRPQRYSSGHGSDNSSILSGELPPAMGRTALFYHSGGSSGYESMIRDSETTGSTSSAHDSRSESGVSSSNRSRVSKSPKKRGNGKYAKKG